MSRIFLAAILIGAVLAAVHCAEAAVLRVPAQYSTIQAAIDASQDGDTVLVADGIYTGQGNRGLYADGKAITVRSELGPSNCIIDCGGVGSGINTYNDPSTTLYQGFTIRSSSSMLDGGISGSLTGRATFEDMIITQCPCAVYCLYGGDPLLIRCLLVDNHTGVFCGEGSARLRDCVIRGCQGDALYGRVQSWIDCTNCLIEGNGSAAFSYMESSIGLTNCTITGNDGGIATYLFDFVGLFSTIYWNNELGFGQAPDCYISADYCVLQNAWPGEGNITADPMFTAGPGGAYYLSQTAAGQSADSPCLDAGGEPAADVCFTSSWGEMCLSEMTTRADQVPDEGQVNIGYHYHAGPDPTATPVWTETPTPTQTPAATDTPPPTPTAEPTEPPTPTAEPTETPSPTAEPTETPSPTPWSGVELWLSDTVFTAGDLFQLLARYQAPGAHQADLYVLLDVWGEYWFYPGWTQQPQCATVTLSGSVPLNRLILQFTWPSGDNGAGEGLRFWSGLCSVATADLLGEIAFVEFGFQ